MPHITTKKLFNAQMNKILKRCLHSKREVRDVYIASTARTPLGSMGGQLKVRFLKINKKIKPLGHTMVNLSAGSPAPHGNFRSGWNDSLKFCTLRISICF